MKATLIIARMKRGRYTIFCSRKAHLREVYHVKKPRDFDYITIRFYGSPELYEYTEGQNNLKGMVFYTGYSHGKYSISKRGDIILPKVLTNIKLPKTLQEEVPANVMRKISRLKGNVFIL